LLDEYYENRAEKDRVHQQTNDLSQILNNERKKNVKKLDKLNREDKAADDAEVYRIKGEVLTAFMHQAEQGMAEIELENFYDNNEPILIELDPQKSPAENAQWYFSRYQKLKNRKKHLATQIPLTKQEIDYIDSVLTQLEIASSQDVEEIRDELREEGYLRKQRQKKNKNRKKVSQINIILPMVL
jgi:Predicted RNA-binding protein homologous to eukaryotic snRNP